MIEKQAYRKGQIEAYKTAAALARAAAGEWEISNPKDALEELAARLEQLAQIGQMAVA